MNPMTEKKSKVQLVFSYQKWEEKIFNQFLLISEKGPKLKSFDITKLNYMLDYVEAAVIYLTKQWEDSMGKKYFETKNNIFEGFNKKSFEDQGKVLLRYWGLLNQILGPHIHYDVEK